MRQAQRRVGKAGRFLLLAGRVIFECVVGGWRSVDAVATEFHRGLVGEGHDEARWARWGVRGGEGAVLV